MPIALQEDIVYILLKKISETGNQGVHEVKFTQADFASREITPIELLGHLDYLNQKHYIKAEFTGNAYSDREDDVPDLFNPKEVGFRIANTYGAPDGLLPYLITFNRAELTDKGRKMLEEMETNRSQSQKQGQSAPIAAKDKPFLEKVMAKGNLSDLFDARDITEVVFRTMRDMMTTEASERVASELHEQAEPSENKTLQQYEVADLWQDTNPLVAFLSRVRPPLIIRSETFIRRINQEAGLPPQTDAETVIKAVFSATKDELSPDRIQEISSFLPDQIRAMWEQA